MQQAFKTLMGQMNTQNNPFNNNASAFSPPFPFPPPPPPSSTGYSPPPPPQAAAPKPAVTVDVSASRVETAPLADTTKYESQEKKEVKREANQFCKRCHSFVF